MAYSRRLITKGIFISFLAFALSIYASIREGNLFKHTNLDKPLYGIVISKYNKDARKYFPPDWTLNVRIDNSKDIEVGVQKGEYQECKLNQKIKIYKCDGIEGYITERRIHDSGSFFNIGHLYFSTPFFLMGIIVLVFGVILLVYFKRLIK